MVPKIQATVDAREQRIAGDLERGAEGAESRPTRPKRHGVPGWTLRAPKRRGLPRRPRPASARETEAKVKAAADKINVKVEAAQASIRDALESARAEIEAVAAEATQDMVARLTGIKVDSKEAAAAVKAELNV